MINASVLEIAQQYLEGTMDLVGFQADFARLYARARRLREHAPLLDAIVLPLAELGRGHRSEESLRKKVSEAIRPFVASLATPQPNRRFAASANRVEELRMTFGDEGWSKSWRGASGLVGTSTTVLQSA